ncbi:hypothetical protein C8R41DRAFT_413049 [Lentinula lateritia]|uniref:Uncharacterized protein n=1 Tax=Lentinula lateritia TaxID=40482 RepID=A0ABQ8VC44_9AGAR|nr:hypothetical protein C8R41DRAFT_413049 [Lentinula lateritia]
MHGDYVKVTRLRYSYSVVSNKSRENKMAIEIPLRALAPQSTGQSKVLGLDGNTLSVNGSKIGVFEQRDEVSLGGLLESHDC